MKFPFALAALSALAACAAIPPPDSSFPDEDDPPVRQIGEGNCSNAEARRFIGMKATQELGGRMLAATGARVLRWVPPRTAITMDFRSDRLTISYDDDMVITQASCT